VPHGSQLLAPGCGAGDAVAIGYNADGIWTDVTYFRSATPKRGKDYRTADQAREFACAMCADEPSRSSPRPTFFHLLIQPVSLPLLAVGINLAKTFTGLVVENHKPKRTKKLSTC